MSLDQLFSVKDQVAIVTGAASGIGLAIAEALAENGAHVTLLDRNADQLEQACERLRAGGGSASGTVCDVSDEQQMKAAFRSTFEQRRRLDSVFANAGIGAEGGGYLDREGNRREAFAIENYDLWRWTQTLETNLTGAFITIREAARYMRPQRAGRIILTTSVTALLNPPIVGAPYPVSKAAVAHLMRGAALELAPDGVLVNAIAPGLFATNVAGGALLDPEIQARAGAGVPLGRVGRPEEIKGLALFLASRASSYMTGAQILIDGGLAVGRVDRRS